MNKKVFWEQKNDSTKLTFYSKNPSIKGTILALKHKSIRSMGVEFDP
jgi:hypothetical protein